MTDHLDLPRCYVKVTDYKYVVKVLRKYLLEKISWKLKFDEYVEQKNELLDIIKTTVLFGESDSVLVLGRKGAGKKHLVKNCLNSLAKEHPDHDYLVIRLNGLVHTDDNLALRSIIEQVHFNDLDGQQVKGSFSDNLFFVINSLKSGDSATAVPLIFLLEEFQLFCLHRNQTLLYNLLDISKSARTPVCVIGITCRFDSRELLEKRVSSRFSQRQILLFPEVTLEKRIHQFSKYLKISKRPPYLKKIEKSYFTEWNESIDRLVQSPSVVKCLKRQTELEYNRNTFKNILFSLVNKVSLTHPFITTSDVEEGFRRYFVCSRVEFLKHLCVLELCLIIAMCHQDEIYEGEPFNFEMIARRYLNFAKTNPAVQMTRRPVLMKAFERLLDLELILPITNTTRNQKKEYILYHVMVFKSQMKEAVNGYVGLPTAVTQWALTSPV